MFGVPTVVKKPVLAWIGFGFIGIIACLAYAHLANVPGGPLVAEFKSYFFQVTRALIGFAVDFVQLVITSIRDFAKSP